MAEPKKALAHISITLLEGGVMFVRSTCADRFDSAYAPFSDAKVGTEVQKLVAELRRAEADLASIDVRRAQARGAVPDVIELLQAQSSLASLRAVQAEGPLRSSTAHPVAASGVCA